MLYGHQIVFKLPVIEDLTYTLKFFEVSSRVFGRLRLTNGTHQQLHRQECRRG